MSEVPTDEAALRFAIAACKGVAALAIVMEKNVGIEGAASAVHRAMVTGLQEAADGPAEAETQLLAKVFGPSHPATTG